MRIYDVSLMFYFVMSLYSSFCVRSLIFVLLLLLYIQPKLAIVIKCLWLYVDNLQQFWLLYNMDCLVIRGGLAVLLILEPT